MACCEHTCRDCGHAEFNNAVRSPDTCPKCGGKMQHAWDEDLDRDRTASEGEYSEGRDD